MPKAFEDNIRELPGEVDVLVPEAESPSCIDHLLAFNFGRSVGRIEISRTHFGQRTRWLLLGAALGVALAAVYLQVVLSARVLPIGR